MTEASSCSSLLDAGLQLLDRGLRPAVLGDRANFLCHPRQGSGRIDVATELGDDGSDPRLVVAIHWVVSRSLAE